MTVNVNCRVAAWPYPATRLDAILPHRLHITELMQTKMRKLSPEATLLHPAKRNARIAGAVAVDKHPATLQLARKGFSQRIVRGKDRRR